MNAVAIGVGCRKGCPADEIVELVRRALAVLPRTVDAAGMFSIAEKADEVGLTDAAARLGVPLTFVAGRDLKRSAGATVTRSLRVETMHGLPSVAETAALAGAGAGAALLVARMATSRATCAIAGPMQEPAKEKEAGRNVPPPLAGEGA